MKIKILSRCAILLTAALILGLVEGFVSPSIFAAFPGAKLGLANIAVTVCMVWLGFWPACAVGITRVLIVFFLGGNPISLTFSACGLMASLIVTYVSLKLPKKYFSLVSVSVFSALAFNVGQGLVSVLFFKSAFLYYIPVLCILSLPCGLLTGLAMNGIGRIRNSAV